jgi:hypothetical protein
MINRYCENCGKILNKKTLICEAYFEDHHDPDDVVVWMPLPKAYEKGDKNED